MAEKKIYFFRMDLLERSSDSLLDYKKIREIIVEIVNKETVKTTDIDGNQVYPLAITRVGEPLHSTIDFIRYKGDNVFLRTSRQKPKGAFVTREYATNRTEKILIGIDESLSGIETYTYIFIDYKSGILSVVAAQSAPDQRSIVDMFDLYSTEYRIELIPIPNKDGVEKIFGKENVKISSIDVTIPVPDAVILEQIFGINAAELLEIKTRDKYKVTMQVTSNIKRGKMTTNTEESESLINGIKSNLPKFSSAKVTAKYEGTSAKTYNFNDENFYFKTTISIASFVDGHLKYFDSDVLLSKYNDALKTAFLTSKGYLATVIDRTW